MADEHLVVRSKFWRAAHLGVRPLRHECVLLAAGFGGRAFGVVDYILHLLPLLAQLRRCTHKRADRTRKPQQGNRRCLRARVVETGSAARRAPEVVVVGRAGRRAEEWEGR